MQDNIDFDVFSEDWEAKRKQMMEEKLGRIKKDTYKKLDELENELLGEEYLLRDAIAREALMRSIKNNKVPFNKKRAITSKKAVAIGASLFVIAAGVKVAPHVIQMVENVKVNIEQNHIIDPEINNFRKSSIAPNTTEKYDSKNDKVVHWHDPLDIVMQAKNMHEDPIVAFYYIYSSLDDHCRNNDIETYLGNFNLIYGTDYTDLEDFLLKNNLTTKQEWKTYVANVLMEEKEEALYENSSLGR